MNTTQSPKYSDRLREGLVITTVRIAKKSARALAVLGCLGVPTMINAQAWMLDEPGWLWSHVSEFANDGTAIGYWSDHNDNNYNMFTWRPESGYSSIGIGSASTISADGSTIYGGLPNGKSFRRKNGVTVDIGQVGRSDTNADGSVVVGSVFLGTGRATKWTEEGGLQILSSPDRFASASMVSADGRDVIGWESHQGGHDQIIWSDDGSRLLLGISQRQGGLAITADGAKAYYHEGNSPELFSWTMAEGRTGLGSDLSDIADCSADGSVVVGANVSPTQGAVPTIYVHGQGVFELGDWLSLYNIALPFQTSFGAYCTSVVRVGDRITVGGDVFVNQEGDRRAFVAIVPEPSSLWVLVPGLAAVVCRRKKNK